MLFALIGLILVSVTALAIAATVYMRDRARRAIVDRTSATAAGMTMSSPSVVSPLRTAAEAQFSSPMAAFTRWLSAFAPEAWRSDAKTSNALVQAGYDSSMATLGYAAARVGLLIALPLAVLTVVPRRSFSQVVIIGAAAAIIAIIIPIFWLERAVRLRQETIRRSLPDALDLIVVCIEAGMSLDAAILRVAKELGTVHGDLSGELMIVNRKMNAGMSRADALRGLAQRTGVAEVQGLVSHIVQGEKWGTSSGKVLRVYATTLRRQRRQSAEKKAATAPVKMLLPLVMFIFPALLAVILGPIMLNVRTLFK